VPGGEHRQGQELPLRVADHLYYSNVGYKRWKDDWGWARQETAEKGGSREEEKLTERCGKNYRWRWEVRGYGH